MNRKKSFFGNIFPVLAFWNPSWSKNLHPPNEVWAFDSSVRLSVGISATDFPYTKSNGGLLYDIIVRASADVSSYAGMHYINVNLIWISLKESLETPRMPSEVLKKSYTNIVDDADFLWRKCVTIFRALKHHDLIVEKSKTNYLSSVMIFTKKKIVNKIVRLV